MKEYFKLYIIILIGILLIAAGSMFIYPKFIKQDKQSPDTLRVNYYQEPEYNIDTAYIDWKYKELIIVRNNTYIHYSLNGLIDKSYIYLKVVSE